MSYKNTCLLYRAFGVGQPQMVFLKNWSRRLQLFSTRFLGFSLPIFIHCISDSTFVMIVADIEYLQRVMVYE